MDPLQFFNLRICALTAAQIPCRAAFQTPLGSAEELLVYYLGIWKVKAMAHLTSESRLEEILNDETPPRQVLYPTR